MKVKLDFSSLSFWQVLASWIPFNTKRYINRWAKVREPWISSMHISCSSDGMLKAHIICKPACMLDQVHSNPFAFARGISMRDLWDNLLSKIAKVENMRNVEELKIWLDTQVV